MNITSTTFHQKHSIRKIPDRYQHQVNRAQLANELGSVWRTILTSISSIAANQMSNNKQTNISWGSFTFAVTTSSFEHISAVALKMEYSIPPFVQNVPHRLYKVILAEKLPSKISWTALTCFAQVFAELIQITRNQSEISCKKHVSTKIPH